jgi:hypothetical protein
MAGPMKQVDPKGFVLAHPGKQTPMPDSNVIECGKCHNVIYRPEKEFDVTVFRTAIKAHYSISPECAR